MTQQDGIQSLPANCWRWPLYSSYSFPPCLAWPGLAWPSSAIWSQVLIRRWLLLMMIRPAYQYNRHVVRWNCLEFRGWTLLRFLGVWWLELTRLRRSNCILRPSTNGLIDYTVQFGQVESSSLLACLSLPPMMTLYVFFVSARHVFKHYLESGSREMTVDTALDMAMYTTTQVQRLRLWFLEVWCLELTSFHPNETSHYNWDLHRLILKSSP